MSPLSSAITERVGVRFRGCEREVPLAALALAFRRSLEETSRALQILAADTTSAPWTPVPRQGSAVDNPVDAGRGKGGGERSSTDDGTFKEISIERSDDSIVERSRSPARVGASAVDRLAEYLADELADHDNLPALRKLVREHPRERLLEALRRTRSIPAARIRRNVAAVFTGIVRRIALAEPPPTR